MLQYVQATNSIAYGLVEFNSSLYSFTLFLHMFTPLILFLLLSSLFISPSISVGLTHSQFRMKHVRLILLDRNVAKELESNPLFYKYYIYKYILSSLTIIL